MIVIVDDKIQSMKRHSSQHFIDFILYSTITITFNLLILLSL